MAIFFHSFFLGTATLKLCGNGLVFDDSDSKRENCAYPFSVDCGDRADLGKHFFNTKFCTEARDVQKRYNNLGRAHTHLGLKVAHHKCLSHNSLSSLSEPPISTPHCPRLYGIFADTGNCRVFYSCWNGEASKYECPPGLAYDDNQRVCVWADLVDRCDQSGKKLRLKLWCGG